MISEDSLTVRQYLWQQVRHQAGPARHAERPCWAPQGMESSSSSDDWLDEPRVDKPLHGPRRGALGPLVVTLVVMGIVIGVFAVITVLRYTT